MRWEGGPSQSGAGGRPSHEVNIDFFLSTIDVPQGGWTLDTIRTGPDWMCYRMHIREACALAVTLYALALQKLRKKEEEMMVSKQNEYM